MHTLDKMELLVRDWALERGITTNPTDNRRAAQMLKLREEVEELHVGIINNNISEIIDGIGDCCVVLMNLAALYDISLRECVNVSWLEIKDRTGQMLNGQFVKDKKENFHEEKRD